MQIEPLIQVDPISHCIEESGFFFGIKKPADVKNLISQNAHYH